MALAAEGALFTVDEGDGNQQSNPQGNTGSERNSRGSAGGGCDDVGETMNASSGNGGAAGGNGGDDPGTCAVCSSVKKGEGDRRGGNELLWHSLPTRTRRLARALPFLWKGLLRHCSSVRTWRHSCRTKTAARRE